MKELVFDIMLKADFWKKGVENKFDCRPLLIFKYETASGVYVSCFIQLKESFAVRLFIWAFLLSFDVMNLRKVTRLLGNVEKDYWIVLQYLVWWKSKIWNLTRATIPNDFECRHPNSKAFKLDIWQTSSNLSNYFHI